MVTINVSIQTPSIIIYLLIVTSFYIFLWILVFWVMVEIRMESVDHTNDTGVRIQLGMSDEDDKMTDKIVSDDEPFENNNVDVEFLCEDEADEENYDKVEDTFIWTCNIEWFLNLIYLFFLRISPSKLIILHDFSFSKDQSQRTSMIKTKRTFCVTWQDEILEMFKINQFLKWGLLIDVKYFSKINI